MIRSMLLLAPLFLAACDFDDLMDTGDTAPGPDTSPVDHGSATITGTVNVQLYTTDADGELTDLSWADAGDTFPFGGIFVAAYSIDETTNLTTYYDSYVISAPSTAGDTYSLNVDLDDADTVHVYAALDWWPDGVIGTSEPIGTWRDPIALVEDETVSDIDITIEAPQLPTGGGPGGPIVSLSGDVTITDSYGGGDGKVMIYDSSGNGPAYVTGFTPTATSGGATGSYALSVDANIGSTRLLAAWDSNVNGLIEPTDTWGAYVVDHASGNPLTVADVDQSGLDVLIPFGTPPALLPFVQMGGSISYADDFSTLPAGAVVYVTALRTRPATSFSVSDLERGYDWQSFSGADLVGTSIDYALLAPSNAVAYVWAYGDLDGDGILNEVGEPVASFGRTGRVSTGTANQTGLDLLMQFVTE